MLQPKSNGKMPPMKKPMVPTRPRIETPNMPSSESMRLRELERKRLEKEKEKMEMEKNRLQATKGKMKIGGTKKYKDGGKTGAQLKKEGAAMKAKGQAMKLKGQGQAMKAEGKAMKAEGIRKKELGTSIKNYPVQSAIDKAVLGEYQLRNSTNSFLKKGGMVKKTMRKK